jgi:hypothetical protein
MPRKIAVQTSIRTARRIWKNLSREALSRLREIATQYDFSVCAGDLIYLNNGWYARLVRRPGADSLDWLDELAY